MGDINKERQELQYSVNEEDSNKEYFTKNLAKFGKIWRKRVNDTRKI